MLKKIPASYIKRVKALEDGRKTQSARPVALFPRLVSVGEWEALASRAQAILKENIKEDCAPDYGDLPQLELVASR